MASPSPSPSARGRRLSELLEEQQEPFFLDVYLLENGYSTKFLEAQSTTICWPSINATNKLQNLTSNGFRRRRGSHWLVRTMLSKILHAKAIKKALNWDYKSPEIERKGAPDHVFKSKKQTRDRFSCSDRADAPVEFDGKEVRWECMEVEGSKQLSPVSVFELHSDESSPLHDGHCKEEMPQKALNLGSPNKAMDIFKELLEAAYTPALHQFAESEEQLIESSKVLVEEDAINMNDSDRECLSPGVIGEGAHREGFVSLERQREELAVIRHLIRSEMSQCEMEWRDLLKTLERESIGDEIEGAIFEEIREEAVFDIFDLHLYTR